MNSRNYEGEEFNSGLNETHRTRLFKFSRRATRSFLLDAPAAWPEILFRIGILFLALLSLAAHVRACGPDFPNNLLEAGDHAVLVAPRLRFAEELERMQLVRTRWQAKPPTDGYQQQSADAELADLRAALQKHKTAAPEVARICEAHQVQRERLRRYVAACETWQDSGGWTWTQERGSHRRPPEGDAPERPEFITVPDLPAEFADYFEGACIWRDPTQTNKDLARATWERLLERPLAERKYKSTWAAYMLGKSWEDEDADKATAYFQQVRQFARTGCVDSIGLATASLGWEARLRLRQGRFHPALTLYLEQLAAGDGSAVESLAETAAAALGDPDSLPALARDPRTQRLITAYLVSRPARSSFDTTEPVADEAASGWLAAVEAAEVSDVDSAEKLALAAYQSGAFDFARRWIKRSRNSPLSQWLQAKLLLRDGEVARAARLLANVSQQLPVEASDAANAVSLEENLYVPFTDLNREARGVGAHVLGELGVLQLNRGQYAESLDTLLRAGYWGDAAYVAERVLTLPELKAYVMENWPAPAAGTNHGTTTLVRSSRETGEQIRYLLARRLTRELRGHEAREFYPPEWRPAFDELAAHLIAGWNEALPSTQRAQALFAAAFIARTNGIELLGTEVGPDWFIHGGNFDWGVTAEGRTNENFQIVAASEAELRRAFTHRADPEVRFHYRYQAAFLAWEAAKLMPNNSEETALMLWQGGVWLKSRDPVTADNFYKALVRRCRKTELGAEADRRRWFPEFGPDGRVIRSDQAPMILPADVEEPVQSADLPDLEAGQAE